MQLIAADVTKHIKFLISTSVFCPICRENTCNFVSFINKYQKWLKSLFQSSHVQLHTLSGFLLLHWRDQIMKLLPWTLKKKTFWPEAEILTSSSHANSQKHVLLLSEMQMRQSQATKRSRVEEHAHAQKNNTEQSQEEEKKIKNNIHHWPKLRCCRHDGKRTLALKSWSITSQLDHNEHVLPSETKIYLKKKNVEIDEYVIKKKLKNNNSRFERLILLVWKSAIKKKIKNYRSILFFFSLFFFFCCQEMKLKKTRWWYSWRR